MMTSIQLIERRPSVEEYRRLTAAVGWKPRDEQAIAQALAGSLFAICAEAHGQVIGMGRVIGDGGLHYYLSDVVVVPAHQHHGVGSQIVAALTRYVESVPFKNTCVGLFAEEGKAEFYARFGYKARRPSSPAMMRWLNQSSA